MSEMTLGNGFEFIPLQGQLMGCSETFSFITGGIEITVTFGDVIWA